MFSRSEVIVPTNKHTDKETQTDAAENIHFADIIFSSCGFFFFFLLFSSPNLNRPRLDVYHTSTHDVTLVRI